MTDKKIKILIQEATEETPVTRYLNYRDYLGAFYKCLKPKLSSYSYLQFADDLGFSKTNVIRLVITGKRTLTIKAAEKVASALSLKNIDRKYFLAMVDYNNERSPAKRERLFKVLMEQKKKELPSSLDQRHMEYFNEWYYPVIREVVSLPEFNGEIEWIREKLGFPLRLEEIKKALDLLVKLNFLKVDNKTNKLVAIESNVITDREINSISIIRYHQKMIEIGKESITRVHEDQRDIRALTFKLPKNKIEIAKSKIETLMNELLEMEEPESIDDNVYQINVQLFPFTKVDKD